jgi:energy-converting hydrogenase Eha subunit C
MKQALKTIGLLFCFVAGVFIASIYQGLVGFTGQAGYVIAVLGAALAAVSAIMLIIGGVKKISSKVVI